MLGLERKKEDGFIEYTKMLEKRLDLMGCLDLLQAFYNMTCKEQMIIARQKTGDIIEINSIKKPVYNYVSLSGCECFSICGWYREEDCMLIITVELDKHKIYIYSSEDIELELFFTILVNNANLLYEKRSLFLDIAIQNMDLLEQAKQFGVDSYSIKTVLGIKEN